MQTDVILPETKLLDNPKLLNLSVKAWFVAAAIGQWIFGIYVIAVYYVAAFTGQFEKWNVVLPKGYVVGDWKGNLMVGIHVLLAAIIVIGGPLQIIPQFRERFRKFHKWLGRVYVFTAMTVSLAGVIMVWTRGSVGDTYMHITNTLQIIYIFWFGYMAIRTARNKEFGQHRKWALRLFMVTNGVWFFRVGLMAWLLINQAPVGFDPETFSGPFLWVLSTIAYATPVALILLELYFYTQEKQTQSLSNLTAGIISIFTVITVVGIIGATMGMWVPRI
ncbi:MAG: DUF2306 domain-containing protein [Spirosomaceae bacterium]|jgi:uncharacterized membrane protein|nr:DUF2306 domain-containing protein [Spirosomataceae bacterium]